MTIVYISSEFNSKNGANKSASDVLYSLIKNNYFVHVISYSRVGQLDRRLFTADVKKRIHWIRVKRNMPFPRLFTLLRLFKWTFRKIEDIFARGYDLSDIKARLVVVNSIGGDALLQKLNLNTECPRVNIFRGSPESFDLPAVDFSLKDVIQRLKKYDSLIFVSEIVRKKWLKYSELCDIGAYYLPNCCEQERILDITKKDKVYYKKKLRFDSSSPTIVYIASIQYRKGHDLLVKEIPNVLEEYPDAQFVFVGKKIQPYYHTVKKTCKELKIDRNVSFVGEKTNALEYLYAADFLVFPSRAEAMPRVILEAMALKTCIISTNVDGVPELIQHGKEGVLFPVEDASLITRNLIDLFKNPTLKRQYASKAYNKYWAEFSRERHIYNYGKLINDFLQINS